MVSTKICCVKRIICNDLFVEIELDLDLFAIFSSSKNLKISQKLDSLSEAQALCLSLYASDTGR